MLLWSDVHKWLNAGEEKTKDILYTVEYIFNTWCLLYFRVRAIVYISKEWPMCLCVCCFPIYNALLLCNNVRNPARVVSCSKSLSRHLYPWFDSWMETEHATTCSNLKNSNTKIKIKDIQRVCNPSVRNILKHHAKYESLQSDVLDEILQIFIIIFCFCPHRDVQWELINTLFKNVIIPLLPTYFFYSHNSISLLLLEGCFRWSDFTI